MNLRSQLIVFIKESNKESRTFPKLGFRISKMSNWCFFNLNYFESQIADFVQELESETDTFPKLDFEVWAQAEHHHKTQNLKNNKTMLDDVKSKSPFFVWNMI